MKDEGKKERSNNRRSDWNVLRKRGKPRMLLIESSRRENNGGRRKKRSV